MSRLCWLGGWLLDVLVTFGPVYYIIKQYVRFS